jgi:hypothetical protein
MCIRCDNPAMTGEQYLRYLADLVARRGWAVQGIERDRDHPPWAYTVGLTTWGRPELVVTGLPLQRAAALLNAVAAHAVHAEPPTPGEQVPLVGGPLVEVVRLPHPEAHLLRAVDLFGPSVRGVQVVWADDRGRWPWDVGFRGSRGGQPVLGPRTATR